MNIGVVIHSKTGHTLSVAEKIKGKLSAAGHMVMIEKITATNEEEAHAEKIILTDIPDCSSYDALIFGGPVHGLSVSPVLKSFLMQVEDLEGKQAVCFVTQSLPSPILGGNHAIRQMEKLCKKQGCAVIGSGVINWNNHNRPEKIMKLLGLCAYLIVEEKHPAL